MPTSGAFTDYFEEALLKHIFTSTNWTKPSNYYIALFTAITDKETGQVTEVSGGGYSRVAVSATSGFTWDSANKVIKNAAEIAFPTATSDWGTIVGVGIYDAATGGNLLICANLEQSKTVNADDQIKFAAGALQISLD